MHFPDEQNVCYNAEKGRGGFTLALIYAVEDDSNILEIETFALTNSGHQVEGFLCARDFYERLEAKKPDLVLLDLMLPDEDGLKILERLRRLPETRRLPVIMVTAKSTELDKVRGLDLGADDYLTKPFGVMELIARVKAMLRRTLREEKSFSLGDLFLDDEKRMVYVKDAPCSLTFKEYELLKLLLHNTGIVVTRESILERVWGIDFEGESRTLDMHIRTLRQKLGRAGSMIRTVRNVGYRLVPGREYEGEDP
jgi:two-component system alkaline phosphatase synthesis response regulator PhoP